MGAADFVGPCAAKFGTGDLIAKIWPANTLAGHGNAETQKVPRRLSHDVCSSSLAMSLSFPWPPLLLYSCARTRVRAAQPAANDCGPVEVEAAPATAR